MALRMSRKLLKALAAARHQSGDGNEEEPFTMADEDNIMTHMFDSFSLLAAMQKEAQPQDIPGNSADARRARNKVFMAALSVVGGSLLKIDDDRPKRTTNAAIDQLLLAFPVPTYYSYFAEDERKGWLPLHWAVALA